MRKKLKAGERERKKMKEWEEKQAGELRQLAQCIHCVRASIVYRIQSPWSTLFSSTSPTSSSSTCDTQTNMNRFFGAHTHSQRLQLSVSTCCVCVSSANLTGLSGARSSSIANSSEDTKDRFQRSTSSSSRILVELSMLSERTNVEISISTSGVFVCVWRNKKKKKERKKWTSFVEKIIFFSFLKTVWVNENARQVRWAFKRLFLRLFLASSSSKLQHKTWLIYIHINMLCVLAVCCAILFSQVLSSFILLAQNRETLAEHNCKWMSARYKAESEVMRRSLKHTHKRRLLEKEP